MNRTQAFTLMEVLVTIVLLSGLTYAVLESLPSGDRTPDTAQATTQVSTALQAAHTEASADRTIVTVTSSGDTLTQTSVNGTDILRFPGATLTGTLSIDGSGIPAGAIQINAPGAPCTTLRLTTNGQPVTDPC